MSNMSRVACWNMTPPSWATPVFNPFTVYVNNFKIVWKYPLLVGAMIAVAIGATAVGVRSCIYEIH